MAQSSRRRDAGMLVKGSSGSVRVGSGAEQEDDVMYGGGSVMYGEARCKRR